MTLEEKYKEAITLLKRCEIALEEGGHSIDIIIDQPDSTCQECKTAFDVSTFLAQERLN